MICLHVLLLPLDGSAYLDKQDPEYPNMKEYDERDGGIGCQVGR